MVAGYVSGIMGALSVQIDSMPIDGSTQSENLLLTINRFLDELAEGPDAASN